MPGRNPSLQGKKWRECRSSRSSPQQNRKESAGGTGLGSGSGAWGGREGGCEMSSGRLHMSAKKREITRNLGAGLRDGTTP